MIKLPRLLVNLKRHSHTPKLRSATLIQENTENYKRIAISWDFKVIKKTFKILKRLENDTTAATHQKIRPTTQMQENRENKSQFQPYELPKW